MSNSFDFKKNKLVIGMNLYGVNLSLHTTLRPMNRALLGTESELQSFYIFHTEFAVKNIVNVEGIATAILTKSVKSKRRYPAGTGLDEALLLSHQ